MLQSILEMLEIVKGGCEEIEIAKGKYNLPKDLKGAIKQIKREVKW